MFWIPGFNSWAGVGERRVAFLAAPDHVPIPHARLRCRSVPFLPSKPVCTRIRERSVRHQLGSIPLHRPACDGRVAAKRRRLSNAALTSAAACKAASCAVRMVPFLFAPDVVAAYPGLGHRLVMTEYSNGS